MNGCSPDVSASESPLVNFLDIFLIGCWESSSSSDNTRLTIDFAICKEVCLSFGRKLKLRNVVRRKK